MRTARDVNRVANNDGADWGAVFIAMGIFWGIILLLIVFKKLRNK